MSRFRVIHAYEHQRRIGVLVEIGVGDEFSARVSAFNEFVNDVALHIAACAPRDLDELLRQSFVKDESVSVAEHVVIVARSLGERVEVLRFVRWDQETPRPGDTPPKAPATILQFGKP